MLLAIDIGNTNIEFGIFQDGKLEGSFRMGTNRDITSDEVGLLACQFFANSGFDRKQVEDVIIASVVPQVMYSIANAVRKYFNNKTPLVVGENIFANILNLYDHPREVGADRIIAAVAAYHKYGGPVIVVDFGTATTFDAVGQDGEYLGGAIFPGIKISMEALFSNTAKLPRVELVRPEQVIGKNTVTSLQSGAVYGYVGAVANILAHMRKELGEDTKVVATGGLARLIGEQAELFAAIDRTLTLDGLHIVYQEYRQNQNISTFE